MLSLGVYGWGHDLGACVADETGVRAMVEEERLTRVKHALPHELRGLWRRFNGSFGYVPWASIAYVLRAVGAAFDELDVVVLSEDMAVSGARDLLPPTTGPEIVVADSPRGGAHHYVHALSAFYPSGFPRAAVLVVDGDGSRSDEGYEAETGYVFDRERGLVEEVFKNRYRTVTGLGRSAVYPGIGSLYEHVSMLLGFYDPKLRVPDAGKTMGLAPYGRPDAALDGRWIAADGFSLDFTGFLDWLRAGGLGERIDVDGVRDPVILDRRRIPAFAANLAWKAQAELEEAMLHLARGLREATGERSLCLAGGVALNSVANGRLLREAGFENVFVQPAANDGGQSIGLAIEGILRRGRFTSGAPSRHAFGGRRYDRSEIRALLARTALESRQPAESDLVEEVAAAIAGGKVVGWFQGASEYGPRALGHRSILADPREEAMRDYLNAVVKLREPFRPFAPSVLAERASEVFDLEVESPFMLLVAAVRPEWRSRVAAITHVDGTARVQTVRRDVDPLYHALVERCCARTGVPLVLNTSFNLAGMPLVETPADALECFVASELDLLVLEDVVVEPVRPGQGSFRLEEGASIEVGGGLLELRAADGATTGALDVADPSSVLAALDGMPLPAPGDAARRALTAGLRVGALRFETGALVVSRQGRGS